MDGHDGYPQNEDQLNDCLATGDEEAYRSLKMTIKVAITRPAEFIVITFEQQQQKSSTMVEPETGRSILYDRDGEIHVGVLEKRLGKSGWSILVADSSSASPTNNNISEKHIKFVMTKKRSLDDLRIIIERAKLLLTDGSLKLTWEICKEEEEEGNNKGATYTIEDLQEMLVPDVEDEEEAKTTLMLVLSESTNVYFKHQQQKSRKSSSSSASDIIYTTRSEDDANALQKKLDAERLTKKLEDEFLETACSDISQLCGEMVVIWNNFVNLFTGKEQIFPSL